MFYALTMTQSYHNNLNKELFNVFLKLKTTTLSDDHSFKTASADSVQANSHRIITEDDHLSETRPARKKRKEKTCLNNHCKSSIVVK